MAKISARGATDARILAAPVTVFLLAALGAAVAAARRAGTVGPITVYVPLGLALKVLRGFADRSHP